MITMNDVIIITGGSGFIGTHLVEKIRVHYSKIVNIDLNEPYIREHQTFWIKGDIKDKLFVNSLFNTLKPTIVVHLAAKTITGIEYTINDYLDNTNGSKIIIDASIECGSVKRFIHTSSQFVYQKSDTMPTNDIDFDPYQSYGESKVFGEVYLRNTMSNFVWTIIRPTNIWGPYHPRYPNEFWKVMIEGKYLHPGQKPVIRSYGFVGNVVEQIYKLLSIESQLIDKKVIYVGDQPIKLYDWVNLFSLELTGKKVKVAPTWLVLILSKIGDILKIFRIKFPITTTRFKSMTTNNPVNMLPTFDLLGNSTYSLEESVKITATWFKEYYSKNK